LKLSIAKPEGGWLRMPDLILNIIEKLIGGRRHSTLLTRPDCVTKKRMGSAWPAIKPCFEFS